MVAAQTTIADVLDAHLSIWSADVNLAAFGSRLRIYDGPPVTDRASEIELWVGATGTQPEEEVLSGIQDTASYDGQRDETLDVQHAIWVYSTTGTPISTCRRTAIDVFNAAAAAIRATTLGLSNVNRVDVVSWQLRQGEYPSGPGCVLTFTVRVWAFL